MCISNPPYKGICTLGSLYEKVCKSKIRCGVEVWGLNGALKERGKMHGKSGNELTEPLSSAERNWVERAGKVWLYSKLLATEYGCGCRRIGKAVLWMTQRVFENEKLG